MGQFNSFNKNVLIIIFAVVITALASGGGVFLWQRSIINKITDASSKEKQSLEKQIEFLNFTNHAQSSIPKEVLESIQKMRPEPQTNTTTNPATNTDNQNLDTTPVNNENNQGSGQMAQTVSANGVKFEIVNGIKDCEDKNKGGSHYQEILKAIYPDNSEKVLFSTNKANTLYDSDCYLMGGIGGLKPSPDGKYLEFNVGGFEWNTEYMLNVDTGKYVFSHGDGNNIAYVNEIKWSADSNNFAIITDVDAFAGEGERGVYVSEYNNPDNIKKIWGDKNQPGNIKNVDFVGNDKLNIDIELEQSQHEYDFQQGKLTF